MASRIISTSNTSASEGSNDLLIRFWLSADAERAPASLGGSLVDGVRGIGIGDPADTPKRPLEIYGFAAV
jgi:hypothetical protein